MDVINFISWIKSGNYRTKIPTGVNNLIAVGTQDDSRDDGYLPLAVNAAPLQALYNKGAVTQLTSISTAVTLDACNGVITTVSSTLNPNSTTVFTVNNLNVKTTSTILLSTQYAGAAQGIPAVSVYALSDGSFSIKICNVGAVVLNDVIKIHFVIIN